MESITLIDLLRCPPPELQPPRNEFHSQFLVFLFCRSWIALVSFRRERGLMVFFPFLKLLTAHSASLARRERSLVANCFASALTSSRYFGSTTLSYSRKVSSRGSRVPASASMDRSAPL